MYVYVLNKDGQPLMPTQKTYYVRSLLNQGKAKVVALHPFTIQLLYPCGNATQPLCACLDIGRTNIGVAVVTENAIPVFAAEVETRNKEIPGLMADRKAYRTKHRQLKRRARRKRRAKRYNTVCAGGELKRILPQTKESIACQFIKNKPARFCNRTRSVGWLTPTANQLVQTHINIVKKISKFLPINAVAFEGNVFAFMQMDNPSIHGVQFCNGPLKGYGSVENAVYAAQDGKCLLCGGNIDHYHHVLPRHMKGSNTVGNRVGLCTKCHDAVHTDSAVREHLLQIHQEKRKQYDALGILNQITTHLLKVFEEMYPGKVYLSDGKTTSEIRTCFGADKQHYIDAYCVGFATTGGKDRFVLPETVHKIKQYRRHDRRCCHQDNYNRKYLLDGKVVATNRHRAYEQTSVALDEYIANGGQTDNLVVKEHKPTQRDRHRVMPGSLLMVDGKARVLKGSTGRHNGLPDAYIFEEGYKIKPSKCNKIQTNGGLVFIS